MTLDPSSTNVYPDTERISAAIQSVLAGRPRLSPVAHELGQRIVAGKLAPGEPLSEKMFGPHRNVSRTSFREAVKVLEGKGLVRSRQNTGTHAAEREMWNMLDPEVLAWRIGSGAVGEFIQDFLEFRRSVEPSAAEAAARRGSTGPIAEIRKALEAMRELETADPFGDRYVHADLSFHKALFASSENEFFVAMGRLLEVPMMLSFLLHSELHVAPSDRIALHEAVVVHIEAGNPLAAREAVLRLLTGVEKDVNRIVHDDAPPTASS